MSVSTVTSEIEKEDGKRYRVTKRIRSTTKTIKTNSAIESRRHWTIFGLDENQRGGHVTPGEELYADLRPPHLKPKEEDLKRAQALEVPKENLIKCRHCGSVDHMSYQCPNPKEDAPVEEKIEQDSGKYVPRFARRTVEEEEAHTVRVTNIPLEVTDFELRDMFSKAGVLDRCHLVKDRQTRESRGFAFVSYFEKESAEKAIAMYNNFMLEHSILSVGWSKPRKR
ncbi:hypothetical protein P9112_005161 [Eukaryota sp. TZLM1-RC]